ncbi:hypothetical protein BWD42_07185 [Sphingobacterium sp. CZ-UAM]|uniref:transmembrane 220 family protein n=1 Tax=Sphingobacterium sp. CZ-UAM TaxID=1933868 RepID=UPI000985AFB7|nr:transmembrane 220 family protein [Sphingobacterium sp. CZ-UAM]OOG19683.1 hypothetical protein BWD42_07185 [Sphingobacterium sp. CZ-UAM]
MKIFNRIWGIVFILCALLQYNDPDPILWMLLYLWAALLCLAAAAGKQFPKAVTMATILLYTSYAMFKLVHKNGLLDWIDQHQAENIAATMKADKPWIEETREFFGLLLAVIVLTVNLIYYRKPKI